MNKAIRLINDQIEWVEKQLLLEQSNGPPLLKRVRWNGTPMEFVELIYALHESGCLGKITLKEAFSRVGKVFDYEIPNYYRLFWSIRSRVAKDRTFFLNKLKTKLSDKMIRMDV